MKQKKFLWISVLVLGLLLKYPAQVQAADMKEKTEENTESASEKRKIRVGYPIQKGLTEISKDGSYSGYSYDYLMEIAKYSAWDYEFVQVEGEEDQQLDELMGMLKNGEIDLLGGMLYTDQMAELYDYPGYSYGTSYYTLSTFSEDDSISSNSYYEKKELNAAVYSTAEKKNEKLEKFAQMSGLHINQIFCRDEQELWDCLKDGRADLVLGKDMNRREGTKVITSFAPSSFYFVTTKGNKEVVNELNAALSKIQNYNPYLEENLRTKYFPFEETELNFSKEEKEYIQNVGTLDVLAFGGMPAIQDIDRDGEYRGVFLKVLEYIKENTGLDFKITMTESAEEYNRIMEEGNVDLVAGVPGEYKYKSRRLVTSIPYLEVSVVSARQEGDRFWQDEKGREAVARNIYGDSVENPSYDTVEACLEAVEKGEADYTNANIYTLQYFTSNPENGKLVSVPTDQEAVKEYCFGVLNNDNGLLIGILNKTIQDLKRQDLMKTYLYENAYQPRPYTIVEYIKNNPKEIILIITVLLLFSVVAEMTMKRMRQEKERRIRKLENERYEQISEMSNEFLFEYDIRADYLKLTEKSAQFLQVPKNMEKFSKNKEVTSEVKEMLLRKQTCQEEIETAFLDGSRRWLRIIMKCITDSKDEPIYEVGKIIDIQKEKEEKERLLNQAQKDGLTGLYKAEIFWEKIRGLASMQAGVLCVADVDHFKQVNDTYGHYTGDLVLEKIGAVMRSEFSGPDERAGRLGGDEFIMWMPRTGEDGQVEERCRQVLEKVRAICFPEQEREISMSMGVVLVKQGETDMEQIYRQADSALYTVKTTRRGSFRIYQEMPKGAGEQKN